MNSQMFEEAEAVLGAAMDFWRSMVRLGTRLSEVPDNDPLVGNALLEIETFADLVGEMLFEKAVFASSTYEALGGQSSLKEDADLVGAVEQFAEASSRILSQTIKTIAVVRSDSLSHEVKSRILGRSRGLTSQLIALSRQINKAFDADTELLHEVEIALGSARTGMSLEESREAHIKKWSGES